MKPLYCSLAAVAATLFTTSAYAATTTIDFEGFADGTVIDSLTLNPGTLFEVEVDVSASGNASASPNEARIYDTTNLDGLDPDLDAPFTGPVPNPGNVLVVQGPLSTGTPNDDGSGGLIDMSFERMVTFLGFDAFDDVQDLTVTGFLGNTEVDSASITIGGDNESGQILDLAWEVDLLTFDFGRASGAIDNVMLDITPVPLPAGAPLLLAGLGAFAWVRRKKA